MKHPVGGTGKAMSMSGGLLLGAVISLCITVASSVLLAKLIDLEKISWEAVGYGVMIILLISAFVGAMTASGKIKHQKLLVCIASGIIYWGVLMAMTALFFGGQYEAVGVTAALILAGSVSAALLSVDRRGRNVRKKQRIRG